DQFHVSLVLGIIFCVAALELHVTFDGEQISEESAGEHDDQSRVGEMDPELPPAPAKTFRVRRDQIDQQNGADEMAARENRNLKSAAFRRPPNQPALKVTLLRFMNSEMHLR